MKKLKNRKPVIIAMVGLIGSGKSLVARELARQMRAEIIEGDAIRVWLRKEKLDYRKTRTIAEALAEAYVRRGKNIVIDSDFIDAGKRNTLEKKARAFGVRVLYVRTFVEPDVVIGRMMRASYRKSVDDFFGGAASKWKGKERGAVIKIREFWRRTPHHYRWNDKEGGVWVLRKLPFADFAVDTTDGKTWKRRIVEISQKLRK